MPFNILTDCHTHNPAPGAIASGTPDQVRRWIEEMPEGSFSVGVHPWSTGELDDATIESLLAETEMLATDRRITAIGEAGIDRLYPRPEMQHRIFRRQVDISEAVGKPLVLHVVRAVDDILAVRRLTKARQPWIWHGFRGKPQQTLQILKADARFYISLGEKFNAGTAAAIPADKLLIETDESKLNITEIAAQIDAARNTPEGCVLTLARRNRARLLARHDACQERSC